MTSLRGLSTSIWENGGKNWIHMTSCACNTPRTWLPCVPVYFRRRLFKQSLQAAGVVLMRFPPVYVEGGKRGREKKQLYLYSEASAQRSVMGLGLIQRLFWRAVQPGCQIAVSSNNSECWGEKKGGGGGEKTHWLHGETQATLLIEAKRGRHTAGVLDSHRSTNYSQPEKKTTFFSAIAFLPLHQFEKENCLILRHICWPNEHGSFNKSFISPAYFDLTHIWRHTLQKKKALATKVGCHCPSHWLAITPDISAH